MRKQNKEQKEIESLIFLFILLILFQIEMKIFLILSFTQDICI